MSILYTHEGVWILVQEFPDTPSYWRFISLNELWGALLVINQIALEYNADMSAWGNFSLYMLTLEDRRFKSIAAHLEGRWT